MQLMQAREAMPLVAAVRARAHLQRPLQSPVLGVERGHILAGAGRVRRGDCRGLH